MNTRQLRLLGALLSAPLSFPLSATPWLLPEQGEYVLDSGSPQRCPAGHVVYLSQERVLMLDSRTHFSLPPPGQASARWQESGESGCQYDTEFIWLAPQRFEVHNRVSGCAELLPDGDMIERLDYSQPRRLHYEQLGGSAEAALSCEYRWVQPFSQQAASQASPTQGQTTHGQTTQGQTTQGEHDAAL